MNLSMSTSSPERRVAAKPDASAVRWLFAFGLGTLLTFSGLKRFEPWDQVLELWQASVSPLLLAVTGHPHFFRYLTAYPGFLWDEAYPDIGFSLYISIFLAFNVVLWRKVSLLAAGRAPSIAAWFAFLAAHLFMNGRGVIAWTAWLICASLCLRLARGTASGGIKPPLLVALSCWLAAVSTGVFIVVVVGFAAFYLRYRRRSHGRPWRTLLLGFFAAPMLFYVSQYLFLAIQKNIDFFGGGIDGVFHMLAHGLGRVLFGSQLLAVLAVGGAAFVLLFLVMLVRLRDRPFSPMEKLIGFAAVGGLFGLTVLTLAVPLALVYSGSRRYWEAAQTS
jgi:hypothetical protein